MQDKYTMTEHRHRFAIWAAGRAYSRQGPGHTMVVASQLINETRVGRIATLDDLPPPHEIDGHLDELFHEVMDRAAKIKYVRKWKDETTGLYREEECQLECSFGRAQKLVNIYLKSKLILAGMDESNAKLAKLHPPIDRQLLGAIDRHLNTVPFKGSKLQQAFKAALVKGSSWTTFDKPAYDAHITVVKEIQQDRPLWGIEWLWQPTATDE
ncbi:hypothetical protein PUR31_02270 [Pseudomonas mosselii]|uniref:hypothetical protein n=1 Tax=unclassified Pseudomonas TaxID=196821 RepID=UPI0020C349FA|nr:MULTISPECIES: hypothetical protein [unclassified Pseudomonas]MCP8633413.1 hypothetical protein [Pseudomonas sp. DVZ6]MDD7782918.1 hypothetical protein [Pseudomonas sp. DVZ24]